MDLAPKSCVLENLSAMRKLDSNAKTAQPINRNACVLPHCTVSQLYKRDTKEWGKRTWTTHKNNGREKRKEGKINKQGREEGYEAKKHNT